MECRCCGTSIVQNARGRPRLYCSPRCKKSGKPRTTEYARRNAARRHAALEPLPPLFPDLAHGSRLSFIEDELRMDLRQEAALAQLEGRSVEAAVQEYKRRERRWMREALPLLGEGVAF